MATVIRATLIIDLEAFKIKIAIKKKSRFVLTLKKYYEHKKWSVRILLMRNWNVDRSVWKEERAKISRVSYLHFLNVYSVICTLTHTHTQT